MSMLVSKLGFSARLDIPVRIACPSRWKYSDCVKSMTNGKFCRSSGIAFVTTIWRRIGSIGSSRPASFPTIADQGPAAAVLHHHVTRGANEVLFVVHEEEVAAALETNRLAHLLFERFHHGERELRQLDVDAARELMPHSARIEARRSRPEHLGCFEQHHVRTSAVGKMVRRARPHDAAANDDDVGCLCHTVTTVPSPSLFALSSTT